MKNRKKLTALAGIAVIEAYRFGKGMGIFNPIRFHSQRKAAGNYLSTHYPGATITDVTETADGWSCMVIAGKRRFVLYMTKSENGDYVFWEK